MKKIIKNRIFLVIITIIICISGTLYATTTYKATDVVYNASDGTSMNVNDALNELYEKTSCSTGNYDIVVKGRVLGSHHDGRADQMNSSFTIKISVRGGKIESYTKSASLQTIEVYYHQMSIDSVTISEV